MGNNELTKIHLWEAIQQENSKNAYEFFLTKTIISQEWWKEMPSEIAIVNYIKTLISYNKKIIPPILTAIDFLSKFIMSLQNRIGEVSTETYWINSKQNIPRDERIKEKIAEIWKDHNVNPFIIEFGYGSPLNL